MSLCFQSISATRTGVLSNQFRRPEPGIAGNQTRGQTVAVSILIWLTVSRLMTKKGKYAFSRVLSSDFKGILREYNRRAGRVTKLKELRSEIRVWHEL